MWPFLPARERPHPSRIHVLCRQQHTVTVIGMTPRTIPALLIWLYATIPIAMATHSMLIGIVAGIMFTIVYILGSWAVTTAYHGLRS